MASSKDRQRKLARAKIDRQKARRDIKDQRRRRLLAGAGAGAAVVLIVAGIAWIGGAFDGDDETPTDAAASDTCVWNPQNATTNTNLKDVGTPPSKGMPTSGTQTMTVATNQGAPITVTLDNLTSPCGSADLAYLAGKSFYNGTDCHEITSYGALRCGDPTGTGQGGPTYSIYNENVPSLPEPSPSASAAPAATAPAYPKGTVALIGDPPGTNGSQFLIFLKDYAPATPEYSIVGTVTGGADTLTKISKVPTVANTAGDKVKPKQKITITSLTVADAAPASPAPSAGAQS